MCAFFFLSSGVYPHTLPHSFSSLCVHCSTNLSRSPDICVTSHTKQRSAGLIYSITQKILVKIRMIWTAIIFSSRTIDHLFSKKIIWPTESGQTIKNWFQSMNEMEHKNSSTRERKTLDWWNDFISFQDRNEWSNLSSFVHNFRSRLLTQYSFTGVRSSCKRDVLFSLYDQNKLDAIQQRSRR